ncbi:MAG TPA: hypothetical protein PKE27_09325 [Povalibacter sp.]|uniref:hypothetical protein n=1 Tax=Povalibacter sp. TaxID=1962978 RepID=UPI002C85279C|nr:hypothetical protein [Povalibacter sp.]HMN44761.1 hypothetical protein [Povalibacter sp.]
MCRLAWIVVVGGFSLTGSVLAAERPIYRCETAAGVVFADRPCGPDSEPYSPDLDSVSVMTTVPAQPVTTRAASSPRRTAIEAKDTRAEACARIDQSLRKIASTMRAGYSARQGERLKERKRDLETQRRARRC